MIRYSTVYLPTYRRPKIKPGIYNEVSYYLSTYRRPNVLSILRILLSLYLPTPPTSYLRGVTNDSLIRRHLKLVVYPELVVYPNLVVYPGLIIITLRLKGDRGRPNTGIK